MTLQNAIEKAIEGGWQGANGSTRADRNSSEFIDGMLLDPRFWQCLGREMRWDGYDETYHKKYIPCPECSGYDPDFRNPYRLEDRCENKDYNYRHCPSHQDGLTEWKEKQHQLIDHLASGQSVESFFEKLK